MITDALHLPNDVRVKFIGSEQDVLHLRALLGKPYIGMDVEWHPKNNWRPALL
jgi:hypothetical protein